VLAHRVRIEPVGREVLCDEKTTILEASLRRGIWLPHACTHGTCGTCKARIVEGRVDLGDASAFALMDFEREDGYALLCQARPLTDVVVEADVEIEEGVSFPAVDDYTGVVEAIQRPAANVRVLQVRLERDLEVLPGQYLQFEVPGTEVRRAYSIARMEPGALLEFHVKRSPGGVASEWIFERLKEGDRIALSGPYGRFFLRDGEGPALFLAGGTGLAPIKAMLLALLQATPTRPATLIFGARTQAELYDDRFLQQMAEAHSNLTYIPAVSDEAPQDTRVAHGRVDEVLRARFDRLKGYQAYVAGPPPMVDACIAALYERRLFARDIYREDFYTAAEHGESVRSPLSRRGS
jgi:phenol hydroxylase P5 protein